MFQTPYKLVLYSAPCFVYFAFFHSKDQILNSIVFFREWDVSYLVFQH